MIRLDLCREYVTRSSLIRADLNFKQQFESISSQTASLKLSNLKATATHQK